MALFCRFTSIIGSICYWLELHKMRKGPCLLQFSYKLEAAGQSLLQQCCLHGYFSALEPGWQTRRGHQDALAIDLSMHGIF